MNNDIIIVSAAVLLALCCLYYSDRRRKNSQNGNGPDTPYTEAGPSVPDSARNHGTECCGKHAVCEKQKLAEARMRAAQYFDDEDLDIFRGTSATDYDDDQVEEFRYVMYTMRQDEVRQWLECLDARGIELPDQLKEEAYSMMNESM